MPIYVIGGQKGGTGKSTIATNLTVALTRRGRTALLVDTDRQQTASNWSDVREANRELAPITTMSKTGKLFQALQDLASHYDDVIVDAGGFDSVELRMALVAADCLYSPVQASQSDLWTLEAMCKLVGEARELNPRLRALLVLSRAPTNPVVQETRAALALLTQYPTFEICSSILRDRKAFRDALSEGRGVLEFSDPKAASEFEAFTLEVLAHANVLEAVA